MAKPGRVYFPVDVNWFEEWGHAVSKDAALMWVVAGCRAKQLMSDGTLTRAQLQRLSKLSEADCDRICADLIRIGVWSETHDNRIEFVGWTHWHESAAQVTEQAKRRRLSSLPGTHKRWHVDRGVVKSDCPLCNANEMPSHLRNGSKTECPETKRKTETKESIASSYRTPRQHAESALAGALAEGDEEGISEARRVLAALR